MYHQINELLFKMILWKIEQVAKEETITASFFSTQYRKIEFASTELINLIDNRFRKTIDRNTPFEHAFEHLFWQAAGKDYNTGKKSYLLKSF